MTGLFYLGSILCMLLLFRWFVQEEKKPKTDQGFSGLFGFRKESIAKPAAKKRQFHNWPTNEV
jgi:hypothetical protein